MSALLGRRQERGGAKGLDSKSDVSHTEMFMRVRGWGVGKPTAKPVHVQGR